LAASDGVKENFGRLLNTLEELVVLGGTGGGLLIRMMLQDLLAVGLFDLVFSCAPSVL